MVPNRCILNELIPDFEKNYPSRPDIDQYLVKIAALCPLREDVSRFI